MFAKKNRLRKDYDYRNVKRYGKRVNGTFFSVRYLHCEGQPKIGIIVSSSVGNAVFRNRLRRRMREAIRPEIDRLKNGCYVFSPKISMENCSLDDLKREVRLKLEYIERNK